MTNSRSISVLVHLSAGSALVLAFLLAARILGKPLSLGFWHSTVLTAGLVIAAMGFLPMRTRVSRVSMRLSLALLTLLLLFAVGEAAFRVIRFDFSDRVHAFHQVPPFYRQPTDPTGDVFFKRPGPEQWTGQILSTFLKQQDVHPNPYATEPVITVAYDHRGFRNPEGMSDWHIAVAGDSFTELGHISYEQLFTSILGSRLNRAVLNLGTSYTGPLTQLSYLRDYGLSNTTAHTIIVFFEGNDLADLEDESAAVIEWRDTHRRSYRAVRQSSLIRALFEAKTRLISPPLDRSQMDYVTAYFQSADGPVPVTLGYAPPRRSDLSDRSMTHLNEFFGDYAKFGTDRHVTVWLAYMPSKERVLSGQVTFSEQASETLKNWMPTDLPDLIRDLCDRHGIRFIDLTPALTEETKRAKALLYNSIYDTHLNAQGSLVVAEELERYFAGLKSASRH